MKKFLLLFALAISIPFTNLQASHFAGADLTYTCLGGNTYMISYSFYRDCSGVAAPSNVPIQLNCISNSMFNFNTTLFQVPGTGQEITPTCNSAPSHCNGGTSYGIQEYVYLAQVTLVPGLWKISTNSCCRNPITTINPNSGWYIEAFLNNLAAPNSSPVFSNKPIVVTLNNQSLTYTHGAIDTDGDSLSYSFFTPKTGVSSVVTYNIPYDSAYFLSSSTPITLNHSTGVINFTPNISLVAATGVRVDEWRTINGVPTLVGTVYRDMQLKVYNNVNNTNPVLSGINLSGSHSYNPTDTIYSKNIFANQPLSFTMAGHDVDTFNAAVGGHPENFSLSWNNGIPSGSFSAHDNGTDTAWAEFSWTPTLNDVSPLPKCFTVEIADEGCPYHGKQIFSYCFTVFPVPLWLGVDTTICLSQQLTLDGGQGGYNYLWSTGDTTRFITVTGNNLGLGNHSISLIRSGYGLTSYDTINLFIDPCTGIEGSDEESFISIHPNPNGGIFDVNISNRNTSNIQLNIYSSVGKLVFAKEIISTEKNIIQRIDLSSLPSGIYIINIQQGEIKSTQRIVLQ